MAKLFNGPLYGITRVSQKVKNNLDLQEHEIVSGRHQLGHNHASTYHSDFYRPDAFPAAQPTASKH